MWTKYIPVWDYLSTRNSELLVKSLEELKKKKAEKSRPEMKAYDAFMECV